MKIFSALFASVCLLCAAPAPAAVENGIRIGIKTLGLWQMHTQVRADLTVWYPTERAPSDLSYGPWTLRAARNAKELPGLFPLLLISHDSPGTRFSHHGTAEALVRSGFVVAALTHHGDNMDDMGHLFTLEQLRARATQISAVLDTLLSSPETQSFIDPQRIGLIGFGVGASTALLLTGAVLDGTNWSLYCRQAETDDPYCAPWAAARMNNMAASLPLRNFPTDPRIRAVALAAPAYGMLFSRESLRGLHVPLLLLRAERDRINRLSPRGDALKEDMPRPIEYAVLPDADASSLMSACPPSLLRELPDLCSNLPPERRALVHRRLNTALSRFFLERLGQPGSEPPAEVSASPPPEPKAQIPPAPAGKSKGKKRRNTPTAP